MWKILYLEKTRQKRNAVTLGTKTEPWRDQYNEHGVPKEILITKFGSQQTFYTQEKKH